MKLMHIADLHLGAPCSSFGKWADDRRQIRDNLFSKLIDIACESADMIVISGDLFDRHDPEEALVARVRAGLRRFSSNKGPAILVPGNHDEVTYPKSVYRSGGWETCCILVSNPKPQVIFEDIVDGLSVAVLSCAFTGGITRESDFQDLPEAPRGSFGIAALHASLNSAPPGGDRDRAMVVSSAEIAKAGYKYAALGHFHKNKSILEGGCQFVYPGIIEASGFADEPCGSYVLCDISEDEAKAQWFPMPGFEGLKQLKLDVTGRTAMEAAEKALAELQGALYLNLILSGQASEGFSLHEIEAHLEACGIRARIYGDEVAMDRQQLTNIAAEKSIRGIFVKKLLSLMQQEEDAEKRKAMELGILRGLDELRRNE